MSKTKPRMPTAVREKLKIALDRVARGPSSMSPYPSDHGTFEDGFAAATRRHAGWRESWIEHELRQVLAWADGEHTATEIGVYAYGLDYEPNE